MNDVSYQTARAFFISYYKVISYAAHDYNKGRTVKHKLHIHKSYYVTILLHYNDNTTDCNTRDTAVC